MYSPLCLCFHFHVEINMTSFKNCVNQRLRHGVKVQKQNPKNSVNICNALCWMFQVLFICICIYVINNFLTEWKNNRQVFISFYITFTILFFRLRVHISINQMVQRLAGKLFTENIFTTMPQYWWICQCLYNYAWLIFFCKEWWEY